MPLILAIEPDRRQANQLNAMVRGRLQAELVLADSAEGAFAALGDRLPDLILTSALLSPNDEVVLDERLRLLDAGAWHVQTLTIPMLAAPRSRVRERAGGVLSALRREKPRDTAPDGCDPAVFAAQCAEYLERAHTERDLAASDEATRVADAVAASDIDEQPIEEPIVTETPAQEPVAHETATQDAIVQEAPAPPLPARARVAERPSRLPVHESAAIQTVSQAIASLSQLFDEQCEEGHDEQTIPDPPPEAELPAGMIELDLSEILEEAADQPGETAAEPEFYDLAMSVETDDATVEAEFVAALAESVEPATIDAAASASPGREARPWPTIQETYADARALVFGGESVRPIAMRSTAPVDRTRRKAKPIEDEWGFFDPDRCGFAALIAKLDEIIENTDDAPLSARRG
jgi:hypothetical protein